MSNKGWECPRCGEVYGPSVQKCTNETCKPSKQPGELSESDLHDVLYAPTISQIPDGKKGRGGGDEGGGSEGSTGLY